jgi:lysozyme
MRKRLTRVLLATVAIVCVAAGCSPLGTTGPLTGAYKKNIWGVDVSSYQHPGGAAINWVAVHNQGAKFAFVKVSEGGSYVNPWGLSDIRGARNAGLYVGAYHFGRPRLPLSTAASDARRFAAQIGNVRQAGYLPPVLDLEVTGGLSAANITAWTRSFLSTLQAATGRTPIVYSGGWFWRGYMGNPGGFAAYPLWAAQYSPKSIGPDLFGTWSYSTFWQYTDAGLVSGIRGAVDASWFHGNQAQLNSLAYAGLASAAAATPFALLQTGASTTSPGAGASSGGTTGAHMAQYPGTVRAK